MSGVPESLLSTLDSWLDSRLDSVHTAFPATVSTYDVATGLASVTPLLSVRLSSGALVKMPALAALPVVFPSSADFQMRWPLNRGDGVLVIISEASLGNWHNAQGTAQVDPEDATRFTLGDGIVIPGLWSRSSNPADAGAADSATIAFKGSRLELTTDGLMTLANEVCSLKAKLEEVWDAIKALNDLGSSWVGMPAAIGTPAAPNPATIAQYTAASASSAVAKASLAQLFKE